MKIGQLIRLKIFPKQLYRITAIKGDTLTLVNRLGGEAIEASVSEIDLLEKLKPCPFCRGNNVGYTGYPTWGLYCLDCYHTFGRDGKPFKYFGFKPESGMNLPMVEREE